MLGCAVGANTCQDQHMVYLMLEKNWFTQFVRWQLLLGMLFKGTEKQNSEDKNNSSNDKSWCPNYLGVATWIFSLHCALYKTIALYNKKKKEW